MKIKILILSTSLLIFLTSFKIPENVSTSKNEYFYLMMYPQGYKNESKNYYFSKILCYKGYDECSSVYSHEFLSEAMYKFKKSVTDYHDLDPTEWKVVHIDKYGVNEFFTGSKKGFETYDEAESSKSELKSEKEYQYNTKYNIYETSYFSYRCD